MRAYLSYPLDPAGFAWPGEPVVSIRQCTDIAQGAVCNTYCTELPNHFGTHYDAPKHFNNSGLRITELPMEYFIFDAPLVLELPKKPCEGVTVEDLKPYEAQIQKADLLIVKTGFCHVRREEPKVYQMQSPFFYPEACRYLVDTFPDLRCLGMDFLAIGSPCNDLSAPAHRTLLGCYTEKFITAIEDMDLLPLEDAPGRLRRVIAAPLRVLGLDSSQVCVIAEFDD